MLAALFFATRVPSTSASTCERDGRDEDSSLVFGRRRRRRRRNNRRMSNSCGDRQRGYYMLLFYLLIESCIEIVDSVKVGWVSVDRSVLSPFIWSFGSCRCCSKTCLHADLSGTSPYYFANPSSSTAYSYSAPPYPQPPPPPSFGAQPRVYAPNTEFGTRELEDGDDLVQQTDTPIDEFCINQVELLGRVGSEVQVRQLPSGDIVANFLLALANSWTDRGSQRTVQRTQWHKVSVYEPRYVELLRSRVQLGTRLFVRGNLSTRRYVDPAGNPVSSTMVQLRRYKSTLEVVEDGSGSSRSRIMPVSGASSYMRRLPQMSSVSSPPPPPRGGLLGQVEGAVTTQQHRGLLEKEMGNIPSSSSNKEDPSSPPHHEQVVPPPPDTKTFLRSSSSSSLLEEDENKD